MKTLVKLGFEAAKPRTRLRRVTDVGTAAFAGALTSLVPGVPIGTGIVAGIAPKGHKTEVAAKTTAGGILASAPAAMYGVHRLAKDVSNTNKADYMRLIDRGQELYKDVKTGKAGK